MFRNARYLAVLALLPSACGSPPPPEASESPAGAEQAVATFFGGIEGLDFEAIRESVTQDFEIIEDTLVFDTNGFLSLLEPFVGTGATITYQFSEFNTEVAGSLAWTRYRNQAEMLMNGDTTHFEWIETAVLQKVDGVWLVDRLHSVPVALDGEASGH